MKAMLKKMGVVLLSMALLLTAGCQTQPDLQDESTQTPAESADQGTATAEESYAVENLDPQNPVTLTLWHYYTGESQQELEEAVASFNQSVGRENGVIVEAVAMGNIGELEEAVTNSAKGVIHSEEMPDIFSCYADKAMELDALDVLCDMNAYITAEEQEAYVPGFLEDGIFDGRLLVLPIVKSTELLYVNKTVLDEFAAANPNTYTDESLNTWEGLYDLSKAYYEWTDAQTPDVPWDGKGFMGIDELANYIIISNKQLGCNILDGDTASVNLDRTILRRVFDIYYPAMCLGYFDVVGKFRSDDVKTGDLAAYVGSSSGAAYFPTFTDIDNQQVDIEFLASPYPVFEGGERFAVQQGAGMAVSKSDAAHEEGACLFLKWFTNVQENVKFAMKTGYLPVEKAAYDSAEFQTALEELAGGDASEKNIAQVYNIALEEIVEGSPYAVKPFDGSYDVRAVLKNTLADMGAAGEEVTAPLKAEGLDAEAVINSLDLDAQFEDWMMVICSELDALGVSYKEI